MIGIIGDIYRKYQPFKLSIFALLLFWVVYFAVYLPLDGRVRDLVLQIKRETKVFRENQERMLYLKEEKEKLQELKKEIDLGKIPKLRLYIYKGDVLSFISKKASENGLRIKNIMPFKHDYGVGVKISGSSSYSSLLQFLSRLKDSEYIIAFRKIDIKGLNGRVTFFVQLVVYGEVK